MEKAAKLIEGVVLVLEASQAEKQSKVHIYPWQTRPAGPACQP